MSLVEFISYLLVPKLKIALGKFHRKNIWVLLILGLSVLTYSCAFFHNFTTYFNVVYLARQHLDIYEEQLQKDQVAQNGAVAVITTHRWLEEEYQARQIFKRRTGLIMPLSSFNKTAALTTHSGNIMHLDSAIILGSKVLADKKETKYVEDALFIVGKSQYYKNDFAGAKRKFNELLFRYPETKYGTEVGMLLARSMMATNQFDTATTAIGSVLKNAEKSGNTKDISEAHKAYSELVLESTPDSLSLAAEQLRLAEQGLGADAASKLSYERGTLYFLDGKWNDAEQAFRATIEKSSDASTQGEALVGLGETLRREKKFDEAKQVFQSVIQKVRYANSHPPAQYENAYTIDLQARNAVGDDLHTAAYKLDYYPSVKSTYNALDTTYRTISQAIMARSRFRQAEIFRGMGEYDSASHIANIILGTKDFSSNEMNDFVNNRIRALARFAEWKLQLLKVDTIERLLNKIRKPETRMLQNINRELRTEAEQKVLGTRWRADQAPNPTPEEEKLIEQNEERLRKEKAASGVGPFSINFSDTAKYIDSVHTVAAHAHFELGRAYENFIEYPSAIIEYQEALGYRFMRPDSSMSSFRAQILYTWVELDHQLGNAEQRDSLIRELTKNYGETIYAQQASKEFAGISGKNSPGEVAYRSAYATLKSSGLENAKNGFLQIVTNHKHEDVAARSLYTIGVAYEDKLRFDSAVVYYRRVMLEYPFSQYAEFLKPKMLYALQDKQAQSKATLIQQQAVTNPNVKVMQDSIRNSSDIQKPTPPNVNIHKPPVQIPPPKK
jgi:TolA-binding protein